MTTQLRMILVGVIAPLVIAAAGIIAVLGSIPSLPSPVAIHWGPGGAPNDYGSAAVGLIAVGVIVVLFSAFAFTVARGGDDSSTVNQRVILAISPAFAALLTVILDGSLLIQSGLADARDAPSILPVVGVGFGAAVAVGVIAWFLLPRPTATASHEDGNPEVVELGATQRIAWMQRAEPSRLVGALVATILTLGIGGGGIALAFVAPLPVFLIWLVVMLAVAAVSIISLFWKVTVDRGGMVVRSVLGYPRFTVPSSEVGSAVSIEVNPPIDFGGWGIRGFGKRVGVITRSGEAIEVTRKDGRVFVVTVPQSRQGAALLNAVAARV